VASPDGVLIDCSVAFIRLFGLASMDAARSTPLHALHTSPEHYEAFLAQLRTAGRFESARVPLRRFDGQIVHVLSSALGLRGDDGELEAIRGVFVDVTASTLAEAELRASEQQFRAVFRDAADAILLLDNGRRIVDANRAAVTLFGIDKKVLVGLQLDALVTGSHDDLMAAWREVLAIGEARREHQFRSLTQGDRIVECSYRASIQGGRHLCIARDVTERRKLEERLFQSEKIESVGRLAGGIAHDFNNLLTAILGYTDMLLGRPGIGAESRSDLEAILKAAHRASNLTQKLLAYGRKQMLRPRTVDLNVVVGELREMLTRLIREDIELVFDLAPEPVFVQIDTTQVEQVILNLVLNARDALPGGGVIRIELARVRLEGPESPLSANAEAADFVRLRVSDNGIGMTEEIRAHVFEPFFTTKEVGKGTGLGLASVYGIVRQSQGCIAVDTAPGLGATFTMHFPAVAPLVAEERAGVGIPEEDGMGETILLVEDEQAVRRIASTVLRRHGYRVLEAESAKEACEIFGAEAARIDVLLSDIVMPGMNGPALAQHLVASKPELKVLLMSGHARLSVAAMGGQQIGFLLKPFHPADLIAAVRKILSEDTRAGGPRTALQSGHGISRILRGAHAPGADPTRRRGTANG